MALRKSKTTVGDALREAVLSLQQAKIESASPDARLLMQHALGISRETLLLAMEEPISPAQETCFREMIEGRRQRRPVSHLIGRREFWGMDFKVTSDTLDPRPDSETVIESVLEWAKEREKPYKILDLGLGTGCLCLSLLKELPNATAIGVDISEAARAIARENALSLGLQTRFSAMHGNWCDDVEGVFDMVVANPPYIPSQSIELLSPEVARHEPRLALDGGEDGLDAYRKIVASLPRVLHENGVAVFEIGIGQQDALAELARENGLQVRAMKQDLGGIIRTVMITK